MYFYGAIIKVPVQIEASDIDQCISKCWKYVIAGARRCKAVNYVKTDKRCEFLHQQFNVSDRVLVKYYGDRNPNAIYAIPISCPDSDQGKVSCGTTSIDPMGSSVFRIVNGAEAKPHSIPWLVSIRDGFAVKGHKCGGTIISVNNAKESDIMITAAHCIKDVFEPDSIEIVAGAHNLHKEDGTEQKVEYEEYAMHDDYNYKTKENDIAIVKLKTPFKFGPGVQPACLPAAGEKLTDGTKGLVAGWGQTDEDKEKPMPESLQQLIVPTVNSEKCVEYYKDVEEPKFSDEKIMFCAGYPEGGKDSCQGDSGGPILFKDTKGHYVLQGVVSFGKGCARKDKVGVYTRVSNYIDWINDNVKKMSTIAKRQLAG